MKKRSQIQEKYKWEIDKSIFEEKNVNYIFNLIEKLTIEYPKYKDKLEDKNILLKLLTKYREEQIQIHNFAFYLGNSLSVDMTNADLMKLSQRFNTKYTKMEESSSFVFPQLYELSDEYLNSVIGDKRFENQKVMLKEVLRQKPHKVDEKDNKLLAKLSNYIGNESSLHSTLTDLEIKFEDVLDSNGKKHKVDNQTYVKYIAGKDRALRKNAFISRMKGYKDFNKTLSALYINHLELDKFSAKHQNFENRLEQRLFDNEIPLSVFDNIRKHTKNNLDLLKNYTKYQKMKSKIKDFSYFDSMIDEKNNKKITVEEAQILIIKALEPLGKDYLEKIKYKLNDKSIDYMPHKEKEVGAYSSDCFGAKTLIMMNFNNEFESVNTLAHELGHSINAEYYNDAQVWENAEIIPFMAEIASTVNEVLLSIYMISNTKSKEKDYYINQFISSASASIFKAMIYTEFELFAHNNIENDKPITYNDLNNYYYSLYKQFYGVSMIIPKEIQYHWSFVSHFYRSYYAFSYSTGMIVAISLAKELLNDKTFAEKYIKFLKTGNSKPPIEALKEIGIDLTIDLPYENAFKFIKEIFIELSE